MTFNEYFTPALIFNEIIASFRLNEYFTPCYKILRFNEYLTPYFEILMSILLHAFRLNESLTPFLDRCKWVFYSLFCNLKSILLPVFEFDSYNWRDHKNQMVALRDDKDHFIGLCFKIFSVILP